MAFSTGMEIIMPVVFTLMTLARKSIGSVARIACNGSWISSGFFPNGGLWVRRRVAAGLLARWLRACGACSDRACGVRRVSLCRRRRRRIPRNNPANFVLTVSDMTLFC